MMEDVALTDWDGPITPDMRARATGALERGAVLFFPQLRFGLSQREKAFLDPAVSDGKAKNISLDHTNGRLQSTSLTGAPRDELATMIERFGASATHLVKALLPYEDVERARTSFRPVEIEGRHYSKINDDRLLHVDAFPSRPMRGRRILRFFANVAPADYKGDAARHWHVGEPFEAFARRFVPGLKPHMPGQSWLYEKLGVTRGRRSRYDELMLLLHDNGKLDGDYQRDAPHQAVDFPAGSCWLVYTDQVLHAALGGAFALEQTFHLDIAQMREPQRSPLKVLERLCGKTLV